MHGLRRGDGMKALPKKHIARLEKMLAVLDENEAFYQRNFGDAHPRSFRVSEKLDAVSLRAVLAHLKAQAVTA